MLLMASFDLPLLSIVLSFFVRREAVGFTQADPCLFGEPRNPGAGGIRATAMPNRRKGPVSLA
jgi:hypothetical protein